MIAAFIDRDGTIGGTGGGMHPMEFNTYDGVEEAIKKLNENNILVILVTNQSRIARGFFTEEDFKQGTNLLIDRLKESGAKIDDYFYCPHNKEDNCTCHKPKNGMLIQALNKYPEIDIENSFVIGDNGEADLLMAHSLNAKKILVTTGWGKGSLTDYRHLWSDTDPDYVAENLNDAVDWLINNIKVSKK